MKVSSVILAGGRARRMEGVDKGMLPIEKTSFIDHKIQLLTPHVEEIIIVTNEPGLYEKHLGEADGGGANGKGTELKIITDLYPNAGVLAALYTGLLASVPPYAFVTTTDTPFLRAELIELLAAAAEAGRPDAVVPKWGGKIEPLCAVYARRCTELIGPCIERGEKKIRSFYSDARVRYLEEQEVAAADPKGRSFININTPGDYDTYFTPEGRIKT